MTNFPAKKPDSSGSMDEEYTFQTTGPSGALLLIDPPSVCESDMVIYDFCPFIRQNRQMWHRIAERVYGRDVKMHELVFVFGTSRVKDYLTLAFDDEGYSGKNGRIAGPLSLARVRIGEYLLQCYRTRAADDPDYHNHLNHGADSSTPEGHDFGGPGHRSADSLPCDRTVFARIYQAKDRQSWILGRPMKSGAGYDNLPPGPDPSSKGAVVADYPSAEDGDHEASETRLAILQRL